MFRNLLLIGVVVTSFSFTAAAPVQAASTSLSRAEIRSMPIDNRPNRPGHFYGNTVRRRHHHGHSR